SWQVAQATLPSPDSAVDSYSCLPSATLSLVTSLSLRGATGSLPKNALTFVMSSLGGSSGFLAAGAAGCAAGWDAGALVCAGALGAAGAPLLPCASPPLQQASSNDSAGNSRRDCIVFIRVTIAMAARGRNLARRRPRRVACPHG